MSKESSSQDTKQNIQRATSSFWKKWILGVVLCLIMLAFLIWICFFRSVPLEISKETTVLTGPLKSDGKQVDYFRAIESEIYQPDMKTDKNGFRMIVRAMGVSPRNASSSDIVWQIYDKLELDPTVRPTVTFQSLADFLKKYSGNSKEEIESEEGQKKFEELTKKLYRPWTLDTMPMMAEWLTANEPALDLVAKAAQKPTFVIPLAREYENENSFFTKSDAEASRLQAFCQGLAARANYRIAKGDLDGAIGDTLACMRLNRFFWENALYPNDFEENDQDAIAAILDHRPSEAQLQRLLDGLIAERNQKRPSGEIAKKARRFYWYERLDEVQAIAFDRVSVLFDGGSKNPLNYALYRLGIDWNIVIERTNKAYHDPGSFSFDRDSITWGRLWSSRSRSEMVGDAFARRIVGENNAFRDTYPRIDCAYRVQAIVLAMLIYEKQHKGLPPAWTVDREGKPLHSWRVLLLPYLGEEAKKLYAQIRLDEPWDSEHNRQFHHAAVPFYQCPAAELESGETVYSVIVGKKTAFRGSEGVQFDTFGSERKNLILVAERKTPVCWMDPGSEVTATTAVTEVGSKHCWERFFNLGLRSGRVVFFFADPMDTVLFQKLLEGTAEAVPYPR